MSTLQHRIVSAIGLVALVALAPQVALGQATPATPESAARRTVQLWSESPDHRRVMLRSAYRRAGSGIAMDDERVLYVVQMYAPGD